MKTKSAREPAKAQKPYNDAKRPRQRASKAQKPIAPPSLSSSTSSNSSPAQQTPANGAVEFRKLCVEKIRKKYPGLEPRCDFDLLQLSTKKFKGTHAEIYAELDKDLAMNVGAVGYEVVCEQTAKLLGTHVEPTGIKPGKSVYLDDSKFVFVRPIPDSKYSLRLFPGSLSAAEYCLDFVDAAGKPVNSPFEYELWGVPDPDAPWLSMPITGKMRSAEHIFGYKQKDITPGAEKFILRDGQTCMLMRPGKRPLRFTVPLRKVENAAVEDVDVVDLPKVVGP